MISYPLIINNRDDHVRHIQDNLEFYKNMVGFDEELPPSKKQKTEDQEVKRLQERISQLEGVEETSKRLQEMMTNTLKQMSDLQNQKIEQEKELSKTKEILEDTIKLEELLGKKSGISVVHKGICDEKYVEIIMKEVASDLYDVDNGDGIRKMDVRLHRRDGAFSIGIECKDKDKVSKADIDKFRRDKLHNKFYRSVFVSTCPIKNLVEEDNQVLNKGDELYIVTKDPVFLAAVMKLFLNQIEHDDGTDPKSVVFDSILDTYETWEISKKQLVKMDKAVLRMLGLHPDFTEKMISRHVYMASRSNMKDKFNY